MPKPNRKSSIDVYIDHLRYSIYALEARPDTADLKALLEPGLAALIETRDRLDVLWQAVLKARATLAYYDVTLDELLIRLGKAARFDDSQDPALKVVALLFGGRTPSAIARPTGTGFGRELDDAELIIRAFELVPEGASTVRSLLDELSERVESGRGAFNALMAALTNQQLGRRPVDGIRDDCWKLLDRLEGQLKDRFPGQPKVVSSFFFPADVKASKTAEPDETDVIDEPTTPSETEDTPE